MISNKLFTVSQEIIRYNAWSLHNCHIIGIVCISIQCNAHTVFFRFQNEQVQNIQYNYSSLELNEYDNTMSLQLVGFIYEWFSAIHCCIIIILTLHNAVSRRHFSLGVPVVLYASFFSYAKSYFLQVENDLLSHRVFFFLFRKNYTIHAIHVYA